MSALKVEVFPIEPTRWIAVVDAPEGPFSTEVTSPELVATEVASVILEVLGPDLTYDLVDESGRLWGTDVARQQLGRLFAPKA